MNDLTTSQIKGIWVDLAFHERRASMYRDILGLPPAAESVNADLLAACKEACVELGIRPDFAPIGTLKFAGKMLDAIADAERGAS